MTWPPRERGRLTSEATPLKAARQDRETPDTAAQARFESASLNPIENNLLRICERAAAEGRTLESNAQLVEQLGAGGGSTISTVLKRLETKLLVRRQIFQKGRIVTIVATGQSTAPPPCRVPHWRERRRASHG